MHHAHDIKVKVNREELLKKLRANREKHGIEYEDVLNGWMQAIKKSAQQIIKLADEGKLKDIDLIVKHVSKPDDHTPDYDSVIQMLEMADDEAIELSQDDFNTFVRDEWSWKRNWGLSNTSYSSSSSPSTST